MKVSHFLPVKVQLEGRQLSGIYSVTFSPDGRPEVRVWSGGKAVHSTFPVLAPGLERQVAEAALLQLHDAGTPT